MQFIHLSQTKLFLNYFLHQGNFVCMLYRYLLQPLTIKNYEIALVMKSTNQLVLILVASSGLLWYFTKFPQWFFQTTVKQHEHRPCCIFGGVFMHEKLNEFCLLNIISKNYLSTVYIWQYCKFLSVRRKSNANVANFVKLKPRFFVSMAEHKQ